MCLPETFLKANNIFHRSPKCNIIAFAAATIYNFPHCAISSRKSSSTKPLRSGIPEFLDLPVLNM